MKMGQRLSCGRRIGSRIGSDMLPPSASPARTALPAAHFDRNKIPRISGTGHWNLRIQESELQELQNPLCLKEFQENRSACSNVLHPVCCLLSPAIYSACSA